MMGSTFAFFLSFFVVCSTVGQPVPKWEPRDFSFESGTEHANPFNVQFSAVVKGPDGVAFKTLGFYDGNQLWKVRVSPFLEGTWSVTTRSDDPALAGRQVTFTCSKNSNPNVHGVLRVDRQFPHWFVFQDGTREFMMGYEANWLWALDMGGPTLSALNGFLDKLQKYGFNYIVMNAYAHDTKWCKGNTSEYDYGPPPMFPWAGDNENPDHSQFNLAYWRHFDRVMAALYERGIVVHLMFKVYNKNVNWPKRGSLEDELYFKWIVARYVAFPNIVWDFSKEAFYEKDLDYKIGRVKLIRANDPYGHMITIHDDFEYDMGTFDELLDFHADQNHRDARHQWILNQRSRHEWPVMNIEFGYEHGPGGPADMTYGVAQSPEVVCHRAWEIVMAGAYVNYYYTYGAWDVIRPQDTPRGYQYFKILRDFFESVEYWKMEPADDLVDRGYCLANKGHEYVVYQFNTYPFTLNLENALGMFESQWLHPFTGERLPGDVVRQGETRLKPPPQFGMTPAPVVLHLRKQ